MRSHRARLGQAMCVGDAQDAQDDAVRASASGRNFFFRDVPLLRTDRSVFYRGVLLFPALQYSGCIDGGRRA